MDEDVSASKRLESKSIELIYDAYMREFETLRQEELLAIQHVRKLPLTATFIAGFAFPIIASILTLNFSQDNVTVESMQDLFRSLESGGELCAVLCLATSFISMALLQIYLGSFKQIFNFARYIERHIQTEVRELLRTERKIFHWEKWLNERRKASPSKAGDGDLVAEPVIIFAYIIVFAGLACIFAAASDFFPLFFYVCTTAQLFFSLLVFLKFRSILG